MKSKLVHAAANTAMIAAILASQPAIASEWEYEGLHGTDHWGEIDPAFAACAAGSMQSPIDLGHANSAGNIAVSVDWYGGPLNIMNNGHTVQANFAGGSTMVSGDKTFRLMQVHFHTLSEHTLDGRHYPVEAHFVHASDTGELAVLGVLFTWGAHNAELQKLIDAAPAYHSEARQHGEVMFDPLQLLPTEAGEIPVYRYMGSLTTPPCTEGVNWHVARKALEVSQEQITALTAIMGNNARPVQPLNHRLLLASK